MGMCICTYVSNSAKCINAFVDSQDPDSFNC